MPVGQETADALIKKLVPRVESLKIGLSTDAGADYGPLVTQAALHRVKDYIDIGVAEGAKLLVDGRGFRMQGYENGFFIGGTLFDHVTPGHANLPGRDLWPRSVRGARRELRGSAASAECA